MEKFLAAAEVLLEIVRDEARIGREAVDIGNVVDHHDGAVPLPQIAEDRWDHLEMLAVATPGPVAAADVVVQDNEVVIGQTTVAATDRLDTVAAMDGHVGAEALRLAGPLGFDLPEVGVTAPMKVRVRHQQAAARERIQRLDRIEAVAV